MTRDYFRYLFDTRKEWKNATSQYNVELFEEVVRAYQRYLGDDISDESLLDSFDELLRIDEQHPYTIIALAHNGLLDISKKNKFETLLENIRFDLTLKHHELLFCTKNKRNLNSFVESNWSELRALYLILYVAIADAVNKLTLLQA